LIDPFGSLSRLKQHVIGKVTREDHAQIMNTMVRFYAQAKEAEQKQAMSFDLSEFDQRLLRFGSLFKARFMDIGVSIALEEALDLCWLTLAECFQPQELMMKEDLVEKYYPQDEANTATVGAA
jgi:V/A-type H+-transporting ATPase subunit B